MTVQVNGGDISRVDVYGRDLKADRTTRIWSIVGLVVVPAAVIGVALAIGGSMIGGFAIPL